MRLPSMVILNAFIDALRVSLILYGFVTYVYGAETMLPTIIGVLLIRCFYQHTTGGYIWDGTHYVQSRITTSIQFETANITHALIFGIFSSFFLHDAVVRDTYLSSAIIIVTASLLVLLYIIYVVLPRAWHTRIPKD